MRNELGGVRGKNVRKDGSQLHLVVQVRAAIGVIMA